MKRLLVLAILSVATAMIGSELSAGHHFRGGHHRVQCPSCHATCDFKAEETKESKSCWKVETEDVCVPRVVFPWQAKQGCGRTVGGCDGCVGGCDACVGSCDACISGQGTCSSVNNGAWVRTVKKLKKHKYECPTCKYSWTPRDTGCGGCSAGCDGSVVCD